MGFRTIKQNASGLGAVIASRARNDKTRQDKKYGEKLTFDYREIARVEAVLKERLHGGTVLTPCEEVKSSIGRLSVGVPGLAIALRNGACQFQKQMLQCADLQFSRHAIGAFSFHFFLKTMKCLGSSLDALPTRLEQRWEEGSFD
jgi:hypothetical protein